jgi:hyaluronan synthase
MREAITGHPQVLALFTIFATIVWAQWAYKTLLSRRYRPYTGTSTAPAASVIVPVVDEPLDLFTDVLQRIVKQHPHEIIVVINGPQNPALAQICDNLNVRWLWTSIPGKRNAVRLGVDHINGDIAVLVDSDTLWTDGTLPELLKPFADPAVGGATTKQRIIEPRRHFLTRFADWMENSRALYSMPAQSSCGYIACLPGRTIAFRTHVLRAVMHDFMTARFLGVHLEVSDDRHLTNLTLKAGWRTVYQSTALVYTDAPTGLRKLYKQQLRWARGSQYNHLRMFPWIIGHAPALVPFYLVDLALPFLLIGAVFSWIWRTGHHAGVNLLDPFLDAHPGRTGWALVVAAILVGSTLSMWLRQLRHLTENPVDLAWMPLYVLFSTFFLMPVRVIGFVRMAHTAGWGTRAHGYTGTRHPLNPRAAIPYLLGALIIGAEIALVVAT